VSIILLLGGVTVLVNNEKSEEWVVRFLNLPPEEQLDFLFRFNLEETIRKEIEKKIFGR
jgi:hypothetical protein